MRRTIGLGVVAVTVVVLAGAAGAQTVGRSALGLSPVDASGRSANGVLEGVLADAVPAVRPQQSVRQQIGTVEKVTRVLRADLAGRRSTTFRYPGARYVKVHLQGAALRPGGSVTVSDPTRSEVYRYDARSLAGGRWAMSVTGDTAMVTADGGTAVVDQVARGFTPAERAARQRAVRQRAVRQRPLGTTTGRTGPERTGREETVCGTDDKAHAACYKSSDPVLYLRSKAVVRLLINGSELCTGWRVGPKNRVITNNHCFTDSRMAYNTEVWFNYQCARCGGGDVLRPTKVWGDQVLVTDRVLDFTLFTVTDFALVEKFGHLDLELKRPAAGEEVFIPQHPAGEPAMIATRSDEDRSGTCTVADPAYDGYAVDSDVSYYCDTEGGSSGSPVLSRRTNRVIALHHFGGCPNSGVRSDLIHARIRDQL